MFSGLFKACPDLRHACRTPGAVPAAAVIRTRIPGNDFKPLPGDRIRLFCAPAANFALPYGRQKAKPSWQPGSFFVRTWPECTQRRSFKIYVLLAGIKPVISSLLFQQLIVIAALDDFAKFSNTMIAFAFRTGGKPVGDDKGCPVCHQADPYHAQYVARFSYRQRTLPHPGSRTGALKLPHGQCLPAVNLCPWLKFAPYSSIIVIISVFPDAWIKRM